MAETNTENVTNPIVDPHIKDESGTYIPFSMMANSVKLTDGTTVEENLAGVLNTLKNIVGEP